MPAAEPGIAVLERTRGRLAAIDVLRGLVIVIMIIDHVRDYFHIDAASFDPLDPAHAGAALYATRWITNFCAPTFILLAGVSAWLQRARGKSAAALSWFLLTRGLWLVVLECTVMGFGWSFALPYMLFLQVIWAIGWCMVGLAACVWLPRGAVLAVGVAIMLLHNLLDGIAPAAFGPFANLWMALHVPGVWSHAGVPFAWLVYPVLPWFGVMLCGYGLGPLFLAEPARRTRAWLALGACMLAAFLVLRYFNLYGDPEPWKPWPTSAQSVMAFLRVQKYPPSLMYLCATLGPVFLLMPLIERWRGATARFLLVYGSVPLFAYVLHAYLAHLLSIGLRVLTGQSLVGQFDVIRIVVTRPQLLEGSGYPLWVVYAMWLVVVLAIYWPCRAFAALKARRRDWWLSYL